MQALPEIPDRPDSGQAVFESGGHHRRSECAVRCALVASSSKCCSERIKHLHVAFNEKPGRSPLSATLRHNSELQSSLPQHRLDHHRLAIRDYAVTTKSCDRIL